jgi:hypothetical protein
MSGCQSGVRTRRVLRMKQECQQLQYYLQYFQLLCRIKMSGFGSSDCSHCAVPCCDTVSSCKRSLVVACVRKIGFCFTRLCYNTLDCHFRQSIAFNYPSLQHISGSCICISTCTTQFGFSYLYSRSLTQYGFAGCELNSLTQGPTVNTVVKRGDYRSAKKLLASALWCLRQSIGRWRWRIVYNRLQ